MEQLFLFLQYEKFDISVERTGQLKLVQPLDYESLPSNRKYYDLAISVRVRQIVLHCCWAFDQNNNVAHTAEFLGKSCV